MNTRLTRTEVAELLRIPHRALAPLRYLGGGPNYVEVGRLCGVGLASPLLIQVAPSPEFGRVLFDPDVMERVLIGVYERDDNERHGEGTSNDVRSTPKGLSESQLN